MIIAPGTDTAMFYFNSNVLKFTANNFANMNVIGTAGAIVGNLGYGRCCSSVSLRSILVIATLLFAMTNLLKLLIVEDKLPECDERCSVIDWLFTPLHFSYTLSFLYSFSNALHLMPISVLAVRLCPKDVETTFYSFQLAIINAGYLISY